MAKPIKKPIKKKVVLEDVSEESEETTQEESNDESEEELVENNEVNESDIEEDIVDENKDCLFENIEEIEEEIDFANEDFHFDEAITEIELKDNDRITKPKLFLYEKVKIIGFRTSQISLGAKVFIKNSKDLSPYDIANLELENNLLPFIIKRRLPNNKFELWHLKELSKE